MGLGTFSNVRTFDPQNVGAAMSVQEAGTAEIISAAYDQAWREFTASSNVTPDEKRSGPFKIRWYISLMVATGERDPKKIGRAALRMIREYEQIARSKARLKSIRNLFRSLRR
jgi:hypothetical protein